jgi:predicted nucleotidyltransferase component of viral defense system
MKRADRTTVAGARYLGLQGMARRTGRPTDELIQLYALECFLDRVTRSDYAQNLVLKGGVLLAALDARRPTRDIDLAASSLRNTETEILAVVRTIAAIPLDDGVAFEAKQATAEIIREEDDYSGIRVNLGGALSRARVSLHVDVNVGDPIWPEPVSVSLPRLLDGVLRVRGYPLEMVLAEKMVTAMSRGTANTRWRDFVDIYVLTQRHPIDGATLLASLRRVAEHRKLAFVSLSSVLSGYSDIAQSRWAAWVRKQRLETTIPLQFSIVVNHLVSFSDPVIDDPEISTRSWDPAQQRWSRVASMATAPERAP